MNKFVKAQIKATIENNKTVGKNTRWGASRYTTTNPKGIVLLEIDSDYDSAAYSIIVGGQRIAFAYCYESDQKSWTQEQKDIMELVSLASNKAQQFAKEQARAKDLEQSKATMSAEEMAAVNFLQHQH